MSTKDRQRHCQVIFGTVPWEVHDRPSKLMWPFPEPAFPKHSQEQKRLMKTQPRRLRFGPLKGSNSSQLVVELPNHSTAHLEKENRDPFLTRNSVKIQKGSTPHSLRTLQRVVRVKITNFVFSLKSSGTPQKHLQHCKHFAGSGERNLYLIHPPKTHGCAADSSG